MIDKMFDIGYRVTVGLVLGVAAVAAVVVIYNIGTEW